MIDNTAILLSCGAIVLVVWRAIRLDAEHDWFAPWRRQDPARQKR